MSNDSRKGFLRKSEKEKRFRKALRNAVQSETDTAFRVGKDRTITFEFFEGVKSAFFRKHAPVLIRVFQDKADSDPEEIDSFLFRDCSSPLVLLRTFDRLDAELELIPLNSMPLNIKPAREFVEFSEFKF